MTMSEQAVNTLAAEPATAGQGTSAKRQLFRLLKEALFFCFLYCGYVQVRDFLLACLGRSRAVVLYYHRIGEADTLTRSPQQFREDLAYLRRKYECLNLRELSERLSSNKPLRKRLAVVTFDDGYRDNFTTAAPLLNESGISATFFVSTGFVGTERKFFHDLRALTEAADDNESTRFPKLTWDDLREMQAMGFEIGSHTVNHTNMGQSAAATVEYEITESLKMLQAELGEQASAFSFPWGKPEDISDFAVDVVKQTGYYAAVSAYGGVNSRGENLFRIRRLDVGNGQLSRLAIQARVAGFDPDFFRLKRKNRKL